MCKLVNNILRQKIQEQSFQMNFHSLTRGDVKAISWCETDACCIQRDRKISLSFVLRYSFHVMLE